MRLTVIGCGHLGAAHAASMAEIGHEVVGVDIDPEKVALLASGKAWFHEPGLDEMLARHTASGRLRFTTSFEEAAAFGDVHFLGVATPGKDGKDEYDLSQVYAAVRSLAPLLERSCLIVGKSTVSVGTTAVVTELVHQLAPAGSAVEVAWNPEFLREGLAVEDTLRPDRIVIGVRSETAEKLLREVYAPIVDAGTPLVATDPATCELVKVTANAFLAVRLSVINAVAEICEQAGADAATVAKAIGYDTRIGHRALVPGLGYGGGCLPKDSRAFIAQAEALGVPAAMDFLRDLDAVNLRCRTRAVNFARELCGGDLAGRRIAVWGAAFKANTDDIRDSPALDVAGQLHAAGAQVTVYDPMAVENARAAHPELGYADSAVEAATGAEVVVIATEWDEFKNPDVEAVSAVVAAKNLVDARSAVDVERWRAEGWTLRRLGLGQN